MKLKAARSIVFALLSVVLVTSLGCGSKNVTVPSAQSTDRVIAAGQEITITNDGLIPQQLVATVGEEVRVRNQSSVAVAVKSQDGSMDSGPIAPGADYVFTPKYPVSIAYYTSGQPALRGTIQVEPEDKSGT